MTARPCIGALQPNELLAFCVSGSCASYLYGAPELSSKTSSLKSLTVASKDNDILVYDCIRESLNLIYRKCDNKLVCIHDSPDLYERPKGDVDILFG